MKNKNQHLGKNEHPSNNSSPSERGESEKKRRTVDENGNRINWDDPEISEADNTEEKKTEQPGDQSYKKEISNDPSIRELYDKDPNAATIRSSNADSTFGDGPKNEKQNKTQSINGDQSDSNSTSENKKYPNPDEIDNSENENIAGDNES